MGCGNLASTLIWFLGDVVQRRRESDIYRVPTAWPAAGLNRSDTFSCFIFTLAL